MILLPRWGARTRTAEARGSSSPAKIHNRGIKWTGWAWLKAIGMLMEIFDLSVITSWLELPQGCCVKLNKLSRFFFFFFFFTRNALLNEQWSKCSVWMRWMVYLFQFPLPRHTTKFVSLTPVHSHLYSVLCGDIQRIWSWRQLHYLKQIGRQGSLVSFGNGVHARWGMKAPLSLGTGNVSISSGREKVEVWFIHLQKAFPFFKKLLN